MDKQQQPTNNTKDYMPVVASPDEQRAAMHPRRRTSKKRGRRLLAVAGIVGLSAVAGYGGGALQDSTTNESFVLQPSHDGNAQVTAEERDIADAVNKVSKSVVSIVTEVTAGSRMGIQVGEGAGTGVIVSRDGYIMTNKHVVDGASDIAIVMTDGTTYEDVRVVGTDPLNDIAFLKIANAENLPVAEIGESSSTRIAQEVIAIGNSLGQYQNTVTRGIISGKGRPVVAESAEGFETLTDLIQTDAAINPGNSGGPLINTAGQVIGINTAMAAEAQGIGFAIPIDATKGMLKGILRNGKAERAYLGINYLTITPEVAKEYELSVKEGAYVRNAESSAAVISGSPADKAGVKEGDIILKVNDKEVGENGGLGNLVAEYAPDEKITLTILRDGRERKVDVTLATFRS